jgi:hypothetical protein
MERVRSKKVSENNILTMVKIIKYKMTMNTLLLLLITTTDNNNNNNPPKQSTDLIIIQFNSILVYLGAKLNSLKANYKVST